MPFTAFPIPSAELSTVAADARAAISAAQAIQIVTTSTLQAVRGGRYIIEYAGQCEISDPTGSNAAGDSYEVWIGGSGSTARFGGAGTVYSPSRFSIRRRCSVAGSPGTWSTPAPMLTDTLTVGAGTWSGTTFGGVRPQASVGLNTANTAELITLADADGRYARLQAKTSTAQVDNTTTTLADITGLTGWALDANTTYRVEFHGIITSTASGGYLVSLISSHALASASGTYGMSIAATPSAAGATALTGFQDLATSIRLAFRTEARTNHGLVLYAIFKTGATAPTVKLQMAQNGGPSGTFSIAAGAVGVITKLA